MKYSVICSVVLLFLAGPVVLTLLADEATLVSFGNGKLECDVTDATGRVSRQTIDLLGVNVVDGRGNSLKGRELLDAMKEVKNKPKKLELFRDGAKVVKVQIKNP